MAIHLFMSTFQPVHGFQNPVLPFLHFLYSRSPPGWNHPEAFLSNRSHSQGQRLSFRQLQADLGVRMPCAQTPPLVSLSPMTLREPSSNPPHLHSRRTAITVPLSDLLGGVKEVTYTWEPSPAPVRCSVNSEHHIDCSVSDRHRDPTPLLTGRREVRCPSCPPDRVRHSGCCH